MIHEFGHLFGLFHTDDAGNCDSECFDPILPNSDGRGTTPYIKGDYLGDTPVMPDLNVLDVLENFCDSNFDTIVYDSCSGEAFNNPVLALQNYMTRFSECHNTFSNEQVLSMHCFVINYYSDYINRSTTSIKQVETPSLYIYPNPTNEMIWISSSVELFDYEIQLLSINGELISSGFNRDRIDVSRLSSGIYFIKIISNDGLVRFGSKFIKS